MLPVCHLCLVLALLVEEVLCLRLLEGVIVTCQSMPGRAFTSVSYYMAHYVAAPLGVRTIHERWPDVSMVAIYLAATAPPHRETQQWKSVRPENRQRPSKVHGRLNGRAPTFVRVDLFRVQVQYVRCHRVQEITVVRDLHGRPAFQRSGRQRGKCRRETNKYQQGKRGGRRRTQISELSERY